MNLLIIDDEISIVTSLKIAIKSENFQIDTASSGEEGLEKFKQTGHSIVILDINLPGMDGIEVLKQIKKINSKTLVIMITYLSEIRLAVSAMKLGAYDYFTKPFSIKEVREAVVKAYKYNKVKTQLAEQTPPDDEENFVGESKAIKEIKNTLNKLVKLKIDTAIMISGASGTGKEVAAKYFHRIKYDSNKPYIAINCAAIPKNLQESEFFGYEKGSFTEAKARKLGLIEKANGGTLFLDEIGDMDIELQAKMLRVLQEKSFRRVGGFEEISFSATIITATNKDLKEEIKKGNFREDLYYRLNVIPVDIPRLRQRKEDICPLIDFFIEHYNKMLGKNVMGIDENAKNRLLQYEWPGNVRELKNVMERMMIFAESDFITENDIPEDIISGSQDYNEKDTLSLQDAEADVVFNTLIKNNWNITKSSEELGISRLTLRRKIQKYSLEKPL